MNNSNKSEAELDHEHLAVLMMVVPIIVPILFTLVIVIGFIGNLLVVLVVLLNKTMRNTTNILIFNLAVSIRDVRRTTLSWLTSCSSRCAFPSLLRTTPSPRSGTSASSGAVWCRCNTAMYTG
jgi:hypothetical protein